MAPHPSPAVTAILCPVDFSSHSRAALRYAARTASDTGASLTVLFVNDPLLVAAAAIKFDERELERQSLVELERFVSDALGGKAAARRTRSSRAAGANVEVRCEQRTGHPAAEILDAARRHRCDLIVIGTEGLSGFRKLFFGSTTHEVVRRATVAVLIVDRSIRPPAKGRWPGRSLLAPVDLGRRSEHDARVAAAMAASVDARLTLVHAVAPVHTPPWYGGDGAMLNRLRVARARTQLAALVSRLPYAADARVVMGAPAESIAAAARETRSDLVVMGVRDSDGLLRARPGSIAYEVVCAARVAVLVLPAGRVRRGVPTRRR